MWKADTQNVLRLWGQVRVAPPYAKVKKRCARAGVATSHLLKIDLTERKLKMFYVAHCIKHGQDSKDWEGKQVKVPNKPLTKKQRFHSGCPECKKEQKKEES